MLEKFERDAVIIKEAKIKEEIHDNTGAATATKLDQGAQMAGKDVFLGDWDDWPDL